MAQRFRLDFNGAGIERNVPIFDVFDFFHRWKKRQTDFSAIGAAFSQEFVIKAFAVTAAKTALIKCNQRH